MPNTVETIEVVKELFPIIQIENVDVINDGNLVLSNVNITINRGEFVYLLGKVGSGKSSIIKTLIGEFPLQKGNVKVGDFSLKNIKSKNIPFLRREIGVVFQDFQLLMDMNVEENLMFVLGATDWKNEKQMRARVREVLSMVGMETKAHKMPFQLSGGEQQRVAIARALLNNPAVILADEPTGNLDEETAIGIMNLLTEIHKQYQPAVLMVTHNRELYKRYPGRVLICEKGGIREMEMEIDFEMN